MLSYWSSPSCNNRYINAGVNVAINRVDDNGVTALHVAAYQGWEAVMELLIQGPVQHQEKHPGVNFCDVDKVRTRTLCSRDESSSRGQTDWVTRTEEGGRVG